MNTAYRPAGPIRLGRDQFVRLRRPAGTVVQCRSGTLWITIDGEDADIELDAGRAHAFDSDTPALIGALGHGGAEAVIRRRRIDRAASPRLGCRAIATALFAVTAFAVLIGGRPTVTSSPIEPRPAVESPSAPSAGPTHVLEPETHAIRSANGVHAGVMAF